MLRDLGEAKDRKWFKPATLAYGAVASSIHGGTMSITVLVDTYGYGATMLPLDLVVPRLPGDPRAHDRRVQLRIQRQALVRRSVDPVQVTAVFHESILRQVVGSPGVMAGQLKHLADVSSWPNVTLRVLPFTAGYPTGEQISPFTILEFGTDSSGREVEPPVVYMEGFTGALYLDKLETVLQYGGAHEALRGAALDAQESRKFFRKLAKEYAA